MIRLTRQVELVQQGDRARIHALLWEFDSPFAVTKIMVHAGFYKFVSADALIPIDQKTAVALWVASRTPGQRVTIGETIVTD